MSLFCNHDWQSKTGMDSGSYCSQCGSVSNREIDINKSSGLQNGTLETFKSNKKNDLNEQIKQGDTDNVFIVTLRKLRF